MTKKNQGKLTAWQHRLQYNVSAYSSQYDRMDRRELLYRGNREIKQVYSGEKGGNPTEARHVRNIVAELIEAQVDSNLPQPKVTPMRKEDEGLARIIEDMLKNEMDRLPFESLNDLSERVVPLQGGGYYFVDWDNTKRSHTTVGELVVDFLHPKNVVPQYGVYTDVQDMDYFMIRQAATKAYIKQRYGVDVADEAESEPEIKGVDGAEAGAAEDMVTLYIGYERNEKGCIDRFAWVNNTVLEDIEDYQARHVRRCENCGKAEPLGNDTDVMMPDYESMQMLGLMNQSAVAFSVPQRESNDICPECGGRYVDSADDFEEVWEPIGRSDGSVIAPPPPEELPTGELDAYARPVMAYLPQQPLRIPFYKPDVFPLVRRNNISIYGQLLGDSDADKIEDQQNTHNLISSKINDKILGAGSYLILPTDVNISTTEEELKAIYPKTQADAAMIKVVTAEAEISQDIVQRQAVYEEARETIGITDSYQGRKDNTAVSGKAKQFSASMSAGRLQSKKVMKDAAFAQLFELMFKFKLAYADEPRPVIGRDREANADYSRSFDRYDFLAQDAAGEWYWNDLFLFSVDDASGLSQNREAMWEQTVQNFTAGAFGDPTNLDTLVMYWVIMEELHYPMAGTYKQYLIQQREQQKQLLLQQQQLQQEALAKALTAQQQGGGQERQPSQSGAGQATPQQTQLPTLPPVNGGQKEVG